MAVFAGARLRDNNAFGTITDNPLTAGAVSMNSAGLANVSAVSGNHVALVLDPLRTAGAPEIVIVTAHTGAATSATITRGAYGTVARPHAAGVLWVLAATADDLIRICTSGTRPADVYEGQFIYETDTDYYMGHNGTAWEHGLKLGAWNTYTPTNAGITLGNGTQSGRWVKIGRTVMVEYDLLWGSTTAFSANVAIGLPVAAIGTTRKTPGVAGLLDNTTRWYVGQASAGEPTAVLAEVHHTESGNNGIVNATNPFTWVTADRLSVFLTYEAAS